ncbi:transposase, IS605 OrfB family, central region [Caldanaerobius fijiensis DSM 17918]|uniref:Transposase, IS605 OrfB family, central region n=1 Tax=Caldanaerobius fijiensis DSM 17918 TaxID=1121256 RepID=A0A1M5BLV8_9THEO|nr:RNA-guided endonuclease TnpB family protein [Caldanaerobius fijiensis]SHF43405.1 transposase, IS605 OrfB family, central region [Caldanaerobius fijiensis DSM 17918]
MEQTITLKLKLYNPTKDKQKMYQTMADRVTDFANRYLFLDKKSRPKTSKEAKQYSEPLPAAVLNQAIRDIKAAKNAKKFKRLWPNFNNQSFRVEKESTKDGETVWKVSFPTFEKRIGVPVEVNRHHANFLEKLLTGEAKQGSAKLVKQRGKWYVMLSMTLHIEEKAKEEEKIMGIDLGLIDLLVANVNGQTLFFHGGRVAYMRRRYQSLRSRLQKVGAYRTLKRTGDKEHRVITDINHKIAKKVVEFAVKHGVTKIRMEDLSGARWTMEQRTEQRKDGGRSLQSWAFYQLQQFIEYKAALHGISVEYVVADGTSMICSVCGEKLSSRPKGRMFTCPNCGSTRHIDANAAKNIADAVSGIAI